MAIRKILIVEDQALARTYLCSCVEKCTDCEVAGTLTLVYDHHSNDLARRLMDIQHDHYNVVITSMHVHLDHHNCLEVLVLRGDAAAVSSLADRLIACNGVKHGVFVPTTLGKDLA